VKATFTFKSLSTDEYVKNKLDFKFMFIFNVTFSFKLKCAQNLSQARLKVKFKKESFIVVVVLKIIGRCESVVLVALALPVTIKSQINPR
jgi:hypothetical protein